ncbi:MAG TPA: hypothetical protein H9662_10610 [Firmicutes bacterium]|nr:hypothetical protein [Bacillota bacterium]
MKRKKRFVSAVLAVLLSFVLATGAGAGDWHGYAVYRDGATPQGIPLGLGNQWHAALMGEATKNASYPVIHHSGSGYAKRDTWAAFMDGKNYMGIYRPKKAPNAAAFDSFVATGRKLASDNISYTLLNQLEYNTYSNWVYTSDITKIRCDGVVEYCYEWNNYRVYGADDCWDICYPSTRNKMEHSGVGSINPKIQAQQYLTWLGNIQPT